MKLTKAQQRVFDTVQENGFFNFAEGYKPAEKLIELGLVNVHRGKLGPSTIRPLESQASEGRA